LAGDQLAQLADQRPTPLSAWNGPYDIAGTGEHDARAVLGRQLFEHADRQLAGVVAVAVGGFADSMVELDERGSIRMDGSRR
jgi:hypothetical protein